MKILSTLITVLSSVSALAQPPAVTGPHVIKQVGATASGNYVVCVVTPTSVATTHYVNGVAQPTASEGATFDRTEFTNLVQTARTTQLETTGVYVVAKFPPVFIRAANPPAVAAFIIHADHSRKEERLNPGARTLIQRANQHCGTLKPAGSPREE